MIPIKTFSCKIHYLVSSLLLVFLFSCSSNSPQKITLRDKSSDNENIKVIIEKQRQEKDFSFKTAKQSPILESERELFNHLNYYPVDSIFRVKCNFKKCNSAEPVKIIASKGEERIYQCYGMLEFDIKSKTYSLLAFQSEESLNLFIPFKDNTSGKESYGGGRYIELLKNDSNTYTLDFNEAYNPYCAYNSNYSCPIPPTSNILPIEILAGEKIYKGLTH